MNNKEFDWTGLGEISGFGGGYEQACRDMVVAGVKWLREHPNADLKARKAAGIYPDLWSASKDFDDFQNALAAACKESATGAMVCATTKHALYIHKNGWEKYCEEMSKTPEGSARHPDSKENEEVKIYKKYRLLDAKTGEEKHGKYFVLKIDAKDENERKCVEKAIETYAVSHANGGNFEYANAVLDYLHGKTREG